MGHGSWVTTRCIAPRHVCEPQKGVWTAHCGTTMPQRPSSARSHFARTLSPLVGISCDKKRAVRSSAKAHTMRRRILTMSYEEEDTCICHMRFALCKSAPHDPHKGFSIVSYYCKYSCILSIRVNQVSIYTSRSRPSLISPLLLLLLLWTFFYSLE